MGAAASIAATRRPPSGRLAKYQYQPRAPTSRRPSIGFCVCSCRAPGQGGLDVVALERQARQPPGLAVAPQFPFRALGQSREVVDVGSRDPVGFAAVEQPLPAVLTDRLQQVVARAGVAVDHDQGAVDQPVNRVHHRCRVEVGAGDCASRVDGPGATEDGEPAQQHALRLAQEVVAPVDGRPEGALPGFCGPRAAGQQGEAVLHAVGELVDRQAGHPGGGQLDSQRDAVQVPADLGHRAGVVRAEAEVGQRALRTVDEELDGGAGRHRSRHRRPVAARAAGRRRTGPRRGRPAVPGWSRAVADRDRTPAGARPARRRRPRGARSCRGPGGRSRSRR